MSQSQMKKKIFSFLGTILLEVQNIFCSRVPQHNNLRALQLRVQRGLLPRGNSNLPGKLSAVIKPTGSGPLLWCEPGSELSSEVDTVLRALRRTQPITAGPNFLYYACPLAMMVTW